MEKVLVIGSSNRDLIVTVDDFPRPGETITGNSFLQMMGGKGGNQAIAAKRAGTDVLFISCIGEDENGMAIKQNYQSEGLDVSYMMLSEDKPTGVALITVDRNGENNIVIIAGANEDLLPENLTTLEETIKKSDIVLMQLEIPVLTNLEIGRKARDNNKKVVLNAAPAKAIPQELLELVDILIVNETEAETISGINVRKDPEEAIRHLLEKGAEQVILTLGENGLLYGTKTKEIVHLPAYKVKPVDSTAAGDTFCGALAAALSRKMEWEEALRFSMAAAAISVTKMGAQPSIPDRHQVEAFISKNSLIENS
ncbi:ribokinase [Sinomicrobium weinanense]|uniref:Ribokinase n=1 Tax=Sinomicrobium weinanense TaxID=2842200 RepID=A0A926JR41_9FLAO|nr:ribokinase [Sinomicrobium weinanense]MBC9795747.1 ribokinase [Sinomicrobium weinanense]MBU3125310.1 ribokinase [Sinomicrobium weinanense]